jgi:hypothetical protein
MAEIFKPIPRVVRFAAQPRPVNADFAAQFGGIDFAAVKRYEECGRGCRGMVLRPRLWSIG